MLCFVFNIIGNTNTPQFLAGQALNGLGSPTLLCILGSRMFFNLKEAAEHGVNAGTNFQSHTVSSMAFGEGNGNEDIEQVELQDMSGRSVVRDVIYM